MGKEFIVKYPTWFEVLITVCWASFLGFTVFVTIYFFRKDFSILRIAEITFFYIVLIFACFPLRFFLYNLFVTETGIDVVYKNGTRYHRSWQDIIAIEKPKLFKRASFRIIRCRDGKNILVATDMLHYKELLEVIRQYVNTNIPVEENFNSFQLIFVDVVVLLLAVAFASSLNFVFKLKPQIFTVILIGFFLIGSFIASRFIKSR